MISTSLTSEHVELPDGRLAYPYPFRGEQVLIRDDAMSMITAVKALTDDDMTQEERQDQFVGSFFADPAGALTSCDYDPRTFAELVNQAVWDVCGVDLDGNHEHDEPLWDMDEDADLIRVSFRTAYGIDWDRARNMVTFAEFCTMCACAPYETPLGRAIHFRDRRTRPKPTKHNKQEVAAWDKAHAACRLGKKRSRTGGMQQKNAAMNDVFSALKQAAMR